MIKRVFRFIISTMVITTFTTILASCDNFEEEHIHKFGSWNTIVETTEEKEGLREKNCIDCGYKFLILLRF